jgi:hypothetical protein
MTVNYPAGNKTDSAFVKDFLDKYLSLGFGNLSKKEIDIHIFGLLVQHKYINSNDNYQIARALQIDEKRLKRLMIDTSLRTDINHNFRNSIKDIYNDLGRTIMPEIDPEKNKITIMIADPVKKCDFTYAIRLLGYSYNENLNSERVELPIYVFAAVFWQYNDDVEKKFKKLTQNVLKNQDEQQQAIFNGLPILSKVEKIMNKAKPLLTSFELIMKFIGG